MSIHYVGEGKAINYTPLADVAEFSVVVLGDVVGYTKKPILAGKRGVLHLCGEVEVIKADGDDFSFGDKVYYDPVAKKAELTDNGGANTLIGVCIATTATNAKEVLIIWNY